MIKHIMSWGMANAIHVAKDSGHPGKASRINSSIIRLGPVPIVVPVPPQLADIETHIANIALFDFDLWQKSIIIIKGKYFILIILDIKFIS